MFTKIIHWWRERNTTSTFIRDNKANLLRLINRLEEVDDQVDREGMIRVAQALREVDDELLSRSPTPDYTTEDHEHYWKD